MADAYHQFGNDLVLSASGDLLLVTTALDQTNQRLMRRLFTNLGDYIWHLKYGAGLPSRVGRKANAAAITAIIRSQIFQEGTVSRNPQPVINVTVDTSGLVICNITYQALNTQTPTTLSFTL